jgi:rod shape-determining protein MreD
MSVLRFLVSLAVAVLVHTLGVRLWGGFAVYVDVYLILTIAWAFGATTLTGLAVGLAAGLAADAFSGGLYGLNGFANTLVGYMTAFSVANLSKMNTSGAATVSGLAAAVQQLVLSLLVFVMVAQPAAPALIPMLWKIAITAAAGAVLFSARKRLIKLYGQRQRARESKLRF